MTGEDLIQIKPGLVISGSELQFRFSRSHGPGGQHVNRSETQVELLFDVAQSNSLSESQRHRIQQALASRIDRDGVLHLTSNAARSQHQNRAEVVRRFVRMLQQALQPRRRRIPSRPSAKSVRRRVESKRRHSKLKRNRSRRDWHDD